MVVLFLRWPILLYLCWATQLETEHLYQRLGHSGGGGAAMIRLCWCLPPSSAAESRARGACRKDRPSLVFMEVGHLQTRTHAHEHMARRTPPSSPFLTSFRFVSHVHTLREGSGKGRERAGASLCCSVSVHLTRHLRGITYAVEAVDSVCAWMDAADVFYRDDEKRRPASQPKREGKEAR